MVFFSFGNSQQMRFGNDSSWPTNLDWVIMIQYITLCLTFCFFFETSTSIIIGLTSQLVDADARENTNKTYISYHHQISISTPWRAACYPTYHVFCVSLYHSKFVLKISTPFDTNQNENFWYQKERHTNQSPVGRTPSGGMALFSDGSEELVTSC